ncbi:hypothetical protein D9M72_393150 [compost metagenome]
MLKPKWIIMVLFKYTKRSRILRIFSIAQSDIPQMVGIIKYIAVGIVAAAIRCSPNIALGSWEKLQQVVFVLKTA